MNVKHKQIIGSVFLTFLFLLMIIPIGNGKINDTYIIGFRADYIIHCLIYIPWVFVGKILLNNNLKPIVWMLFGVILSAVLEFIQLIIPYRSSNINDMIAGIIGVLLSYALFKFTQRFKCLNLTK